MEKAKKDLKIFSNLFIFLGVWDIISFLIDYFFGSLTLENLKTMATPGVAIVSWIILIIVLIVLVAIKMYLGIKGLQQVKGNTKGKGNVRLAKVIYVILIVCFILSLVTIFQGSGSYLDLINYVVNIIIIHYYIQYVNAVIK